MSTSSVRLAAVFVIVGLASFMLCAGKAEAVSFDLTSGGSVIINGAIFQTGEVQPAGTGVIDSFVRIQRNVSEQGYNTDGRPVPFDEKSDPNFTRSLLVSEVPTKTIGGVEFREFILDINEQASATGRYLSLDELQIYLSPVGNSTTTNLSLLGTLVYDLDAGADNWIKLNGNLFPPGSGTSDMFAYIPNSLFVGPNPYVTLYSQFGLNFSSDAGFEEWAVRGGAGNAPVVPEPATALLVGTGFGALGAWRKFRRNGQHDSVASSH